MLFSTRKIFFAILLALLISIPLASAQQEPARVTSPTSQTLNYITPVSSSEAWAVGDNGAIIKWDGTAWSLVPSSTTANLNSISFGNASSGWAVGALNNDGIILYWNGSTWNTWTDVAIDTTGLTGIPLYGVSMLGGSFGWAVGASGTVVVWDGTQWAGQKNVTPNTLRSVATVSQTDAWAVGDNGVIMRWTGTEWTSISSPTGSNLYSVFTFNPTNAWAVGGEQNTGVILHWDGSNWTEWTDIIMYHPESDTAPPSELVDHVNATLHSVFVCDTGDGWASGTDGMVVYWNGTLWNAISSGASETLRGISVVVPATGTTPSKGYAVGDGGIILGWEGHQWIPEISIFVLAPILLTFAALLLILKKTAKRPNLFFFRK